MNRIRHWLPRSGRLAQFRQGHPRRSAPRPHRRPTARGDRGKHEKRTGPARGGAPSPSLPGPARRGHELDPQQAQRCGETERWSIAAGASSSSTTPERSGARGNVPAAPVVGGDRKATEPLHVPLSAPLHGTAWSSPGRPGDLADIVARHALDPDHGAGQERRLDPRPQCGQDHPRAAVRAPRRRR